MTINRAKDGCGMGLWMRLRGRWGRSGRRLRATARQRFGYHDLRPGQQEAMTHLLNGRDVLVVMPTGSGKSAVYQVPAQLLDGPTIVISPLIALQRDQMPSLAEPTPGGAVVGQLGPVRRASASRWRSPRRQGASTSSSRPSSSPSPRSSTGSRARGPR